jgi:hypothetical protein
MDESLGILRFLAEHPENYDYFYHGIAPPDPPGPTVKTITEMFANYMEHVVLQLETMRRSERKYWSKFVKDTYARSPVIRTHLREFKEWYDPGLQRLVAQVPPMMPSDA